MKGLPPKGQPRPHARNGKRKTAQNLGGFRVKGIWVGIVDPPECVAVAVLRYDLVEEHAVQSRVPVGGDGSDGILGRRLHRHQFSRMEARQHARAGDHQERGLPAPHGGSQLRPHGRSQQQSQDPPHGFPRPGHGTAPSPQADCWW